MSGDQERCCNCNELGVLQPLCMTCQFWFCDSCTAQILDPENLVGNDWTPCMQIDGSCTRARPALYGSGPGMELVPCVRHGLRVRFCMPGNKRTHVPLVPRAVVTRVACRTC